MSKDLDTLKAISYFSTTLHNKISVMEVLWDITKNIIHRLGYSDCVIYTFDSERNILVQSAAYGLKNPSGKTIYNQIEIPVGEGVVGYVAETRSPVIINDTAKDERYIVDDLERRSEISVPIMINEDLFGVIDSEHPEASFFDETDLHILTIIASICAQKIKEIKSQTKTVFTRENEYYKQLITLLEKDKIYRDPTLSQENVAERLSISSSYLSKLINTLTGNSFVKLINTYRIEDVKKNLFSPEFQHYTILSIGLEAGFNSKASFQRNFKEITGLTPNEFVEKRKKTKS